jgi:hypothetical protein
MVGDALSFTEGKEKVNHGLPLEGFDHVHYISAGRQGDPGRSRPSSTSSTTTPSLNFTGHTGEVLQPPPHHPMAHSKTKKLKALPASLRFQWLCSWWIMAP